MSESPAAPLAATAAPFVEATVNYSDPNAPIGVKVHGDAGRSTMSRVPHRVRITDARPNAGDFTLDRNGFALLKHRSAVLDFDDEKQRRTIYYPEIERLVKELTGATKVLIFRPVMREEGTAMPPAAGVHIDYNEIQYNRWAEEILGPDVASEYLQRPWIGLNLWRPVRPVERMPLAVCDAATVKKQDLKPALMQDRMGDENPREGYNVVHSPAHRWFYFSAMQPDEVVAIKLCDSDRTKPQWTAHTAFDDPTSRKDAAPRKSLELRTMAFLPAR